MDRSLVQAKTSRSRSTRASDIGNGMMKLATRGMLHAACQHRLSARVRSGCTGFHRGFRIRCAGRGKPVAGLAALRLASTDQQAN